MQKKIILLTTFVNPSYLENFLNMLEKRHSIKRESVFIFETSGEDLILTFKIYLNIGERIDIRKEFRRTLQIHKKGKTFFTINALNRLIEIDFNLTPGNIDYKSHEVDWSKYSDKMILLKNNELEILDIKRKIIE
tara:strand:+ start:1372 stop:1776 length:405 start_codon:yes stop_codon:yes gene_type:complete